MAFPCWKSSRAERARAASPAGNSLRGPSCPLCREKRPIQGGRNAVPFHFPCVLMPLEESCTPGSQHFLRAARLMRAEALGRMQVRLTSRPSSCSCRSRALGAGQSSVFLAKPVQPDAFLLRAGMKPAPPAARGIARQQRNMPGQVAAVPQAPQGFMALAEQTGIRTTGRGRLHPAPSASMSVALYSARMRQGQQGEAIRLWDRGVVWPCVLQRDV